MDHPIASYLLLAFISVLLASSVLGQDRITGRSFATRSEVIAQHGMAATSQPLATQAALDVLKSGGNAIDAAICANALLGLVEPTGNGMGGDLFAIVWDAKTKRLYGYNGSGRSPMSLSMEHFEKAGLKKVPSHGPLSVSVPGCVDGWFALHEKFGSKPMAELLAPTIRYAEEGVPISELIAYYWDKSVPKLSAYPGFANQFTTNGHAPRKGELWRNPGIAATLRQLSEGGRDAFYKGPVAQVIGEYIQANGGFLSAEDMASHKGEWVEPVSTNYRGVDLWELPPNGQGIAALQILNILEAYDLRSMGFGSADYIHHFVEAKKLAFEDRARFYADPSMVEVPVDELISKPYAAKRRKHLNPKRAGKQVPAGNPALGSGDTIYLCTADEEGNMVSLIQSNYRGMGSGMTPPGLGFILQDRGELFDLTPGRPNSYAPGKRPFHTIIPAFATKDGKPWIAFGVMGGATQPQAHAQILINMLDFDMGLQEAGDAPRILHSESSQPTGERMTDGGELSLESGIEYEAIRELVERKHKIVWKVGPYGGYQAILRDPVSGVYYGASESRKDGQAAGW